MTQLASHQARVAGELTAAAPAWSAELLDVVVAGGTLDAAAALGVYRSGYVARLTEQLGETYATVWRVLGDEAFFALCGRYIAAHASTSYNLSDYGREFPACLESDVATVAEPYLPELARFELAFHDLFHEAAHSAVGAAALAAIGDLAGVRLQIGSAVRLIACEYAVHELFRHRGESQAPAVALQRPQWMLLYKHGDDVMARELDAASFAALDALSRGLDVGAAIDAAVARAADFGPAEVASLFETIARCALVTAWHR